MYPYYIDDYTPPDMSLMVEDGMVTVNFTIEMDSILEGEEFFTFFVEADGLSGLLPEVFRVTIMDSCE